MANEEPLKLGERVKVLWPARMNSPQGEVIGLLDDGDRVIVKFSETDSVTANRKYVRRAA